MTTDDPWKDRDVAAVLFIGLVLGLIVGIWIPL